MNHILHIHSENRFTWIQQSDMGDILSTQEINHLAALGAIKAKEPWLILIPGQHVFLTSAHLPKTNKRELQKAIPFALEEQVINEVEKLYFACGEYDAKNQLTIAVIDKKLFENYLHLLKSYSVFPSIILPDFLAIPYIDKGWTFVIQDDRILVRMSRQRGSSIFHNNFDLLLQLLLEHHKDNLPEKINIYNISSYPQKNLLFAHQQIPIENKENENPFIYFQTLQSPPLNLMQNQYRPKTPSTSKKREWRYAKITAVAAISIWLSSKIIIWFDFKMHSHYLQTQITKNYLQVFPNASDVTDPRNQIAHELEALTQNSQGSRFTNLLGKTAVILQHYPMIHLQSLNYQQDQLTLAITTENLTYLTQLTHELSEKGLTVTQNQVNNGNKQLSAELILK